MTSRFFTTTFFLLLGIASTARCATIELANGYKLEGTILSRDDKALHLDTPLLGKVDIPLSNVVKISGEEKAREQPATAAQATPAPVPATTKATASTPAVSEAKTTSESIDAFLERIRLLKGWKTDLAIGLGYVSGEKDSANTTVTFNTEHKWTSQEFRYELLQEYEKVAAPHGDDYVSKDRLKTSARYRHDISERIFGGFKSSYSYDSIKEIDRDLSESLGIGWRAFKTPRLNLTFTPACTLQKQIIRGESKDIIYSPTFFEELTYDLTKTTSLRQEFTVLFPVNGGNDNSYHFSLTFKSMLSDHLSLNFLYLFDSDGTLPSDIEPAESSVNMLLGVSF